MVKKLILFQNLKFHYTAYKGPAMVLSQINQVHTLKSCFFFKIYFNIIIYIQVFHEVFYLQVYQTEFYIYLSFLPAIHFIHLILLNVIILIIFPQKMYSITACQFNTALVSSDYLSIIYSLLTILLLFSIKLTYKEDAGT